MIRQEMIQEILTLEAKRDKLLNEGNVKALLMKSKGKEDFADLPVHKHDADTLEGYSIGALRAILSITSDHVNLISRLIESIETFPKPVKWSLHLEQIKQGKLDPIKKILIEGEGLDLTIKEERAIFTIQKLLTETNYKGNHKEGMALAIKPFDYYKAYGVKKVEDGNFHRAEKNEALEALELLGNRKQRVAYERGEGKGKETFEYNASLIQVGFNYPGGYQEDKRKRNEILKLIVIYPSPVFLDDIERYFGLCSADYLQKLKPYCSGRAGIFLTNLANYIKEQAGHKNRKKMEPPWVVKIDYKKLAAKLKMKSKLEAKQYSLLKETLKEMGKVLVEVSYLTGFELKNDQVKLTINHSVF